MLRQLCATIGAASALASCGGGDGVTPPSVGGVNSVAVTPASITLKTAETAQLTVHVDAGVGVSNEVVWSTSDAPVATVSASGVVTGVAPGAATVVATAKADPRKMASATITVLQVTNTLTVVVGPGVVAIPDTGERSYPSNSQVSYQFQLKPGYEHLLVRRDTITVPPTGTISLSRDMRLLAVADSVLLVAPADQASLVSPIRQMLTSSNPLPGYFAFQSAADQLYSTLPRAEAAQRIQAAFNSAFDPARDAKALRLASVRILDSLQKATSSPPLRAAPLAKITAGKLDPLPVTFLFSNGVFTPAKSPPITLKYYLTPTIVRAGFPSPTVDFVLNRSGLDEGTDAVQAWNCLTALPLQLSSVAAAFQCLASYQGVTALADLGESATQYFIPPILRVTEDARRLADRIRAEYLLGNAVIVIAHSQGNLVTEQALSILQTESPPLVAASCVGVVSIAPPRPRIGWGDQVTDMIIRDGVAQDILSLFSIADASTPSVSNSLSASYKLSSSFFVMAVLHGLSLHDIQGSYLAQVETEAVIIGALQAQANKLKARCTALTPAQLDVTSNTATSWTITPGGLSGSGLTASYSVRPGASGTTYTITPAVLPGRTVSLSGTDGVGPSVRLLPGQTKSLAITYSPLTQPPGLLPPPSLLAPPNGTSGSSTLPTFSWSAVAGANGYWLMIATSPSAFPTDPAASTCPGCLMAGFTTTTSHSLPNAFPNGGSAIVALSGGTTYYWKVQAFNNSTSPTTQGQYSATNSFTTAAATSPSITLDRTTVPFTYTVGGPVPGRQVVNITNGGSGTLNGLSIGSVTYAPGQPTGWLNTALTATTAPAGLTLTLLPGSLSSGTYNAIVPISSTATGITNSPQQVAVTFVVAQRPGLVDISTGGETSCGRTQGGVGYCWGWNIWGQLGDGTNTSRTIPTLVAGNHVFARIYSGGGVSCGLTNSGSAYCWGNNNYGLIGNGTTSWSDVPVPTAGGLSFVELSLGGANCGRTATGSTYCWGQNNVGQSGSGSNSQDILAPSLVVGGLVFTSLSGNSGSPTTCGLIVTGEAYCWGANFLYGNIGDGTRENRATPTAVAGGLRFSQIRAGSASTCGLTLDGVAYCWGANSSGSVGDGTTIDRSVPTRVAGNLTFTSLASGGGTACGITGAGAMYCWGENFYGALGDGTTVSRSVPTLVLGGLSFVTVYAGGNQTCGRVVTGEFYCWGLNEFGQLGDGTTVNRTVPTLVRSP